MIRSTDPDARTSKIARTAPAMVRHAQGSSYPDRDGRVFGVLLPLELDEGVVGSTSDGDRQVNVYTTSAGRELAIDAAGEVTISEVMP